MKIRNSSLSFAVLSASLWLAAAAAFFWAFQPAQADEGRKPYVFRVQEEFLLYNEDSDSTFAKGSLEFIIEGKFKNDPHLTLRKEKREPPGYHTNTVLSYTGTISEGDVVRAKAVLHHHDGTPNFCKFNIWVSPLFQEGSIFNNYEPKYSELRQHVFINDGTKVLNSSLASKDYTVEKGIKKVEVETMYLDYGRYGIYIHCTFSVDKSSKQKVVKKAETAGGEDKGTDIKPDIIEKDKPASGESSLPGAVAVSVGGALAAAGAAAAARGAAGASSSESGEEEEKKRSIYKMFINKDFGNKLRPGDPPRTVGARIEEIKEGRRIKRDDLTRKIQVSAGENMSVLSRAFSGHYLEAGIQACVPSGTAAKEASVVFSYSSEGGCFENHIVFQLVGDVRIVFPDLASDGQGLNINSDNSLVAMVAGAGGTERLRFLFLDNTEEPENIVFIGDRSFSIRAERDDKYPSCYFAVIDNHSASLQQENGIFAGRKVVEITVEAVFADKSKVRGAFTIELYPQGLSVLINSGRNNLLPRDPGLRRVLKDGCLEVLSYATRDKGELTFDPLIRPTGFDLCFAAVKSDGTASVALEAQAFTFGRMQPADEATRNILAKYEYTIGTTGGFSVEPQSELPEIGGRYLVKLPVRASWEGCAEQGEIPIRLLGEPLDIMREWNAEYKALKDSVIRNFPAEWAHRHIQYIEQEYSDPSLYDKTQLRILRVSLLRASQEY